MIPADTPNLPDDPALPEARLRELVRVMAALRTPVTGCPWDLEQSYATIAPYTIEEAYEVADAIARNDRTDLKEELGDLLLQVVYHAQIAREENAFTIDDVIGGIVTKMIRRHPHVFGDDAARSAGAAKGFWEKIKAEEKAERAAERARLAAVSGKAAAPTQFSKSILADIPAGMPALTRAIKLQDKAANVGFDWPSLAPVLDKMKEELAELEAELIAPLDAQSITLTEAGSTRIAEEFGDLLFVMANVARHLKLDPEATLRAANDKFTRRFQHIEIALAAQGRSPAQSTLEEMDALWDQAKERE